MWSNMHYFVSLFMREKTYANQWQFQMSGCCTYQYLYIDYGAKCASWRPGRVSTGHIHSSIHSLTPAGDLGYMSFSIAVFFISFQLCWYPKRKRIPSWKHFPLNVSNFKTTENVKIHSLIQSKQVLKSWEVTGMRMKDDGPLMTWQHCEYFHWRVVEGSSIFLWRQKDK